MTDGENEAFERALSRALRAADVEHLFGLHLVELDSRLHDMETGALQRLGSSLALFAPRCVVALTRLHLVAQCVADILEGRHAALP